MYKVFVNDYPIILTDAKNISTKYNRVNFNEFELNALVDALFEEKLKGICLYTSDLLDSWKQFKKQFKLQLAAGGKVVNNNEAVLFIKRFGRWDLPKGKLERGESIEECALREVEEECGLSELTIQRKLETTFHIFKREKKTILKETHWFLMHTDFKGNLIPQLEEGIEEAVFINTASSKYALDNTYGNIRLLFE